MAINYLLEINNVIQGVLMVNTMMTKECVNFVSVYVFNAQDLVIINVTHALMDSKMHNLIFLLNILISKIINSLKYQSQCFKECPIGTYKYGIHNECFRCSNLCKTCVNEDY